MTDIIILLYIVGKTLIKSLLQACIYSKCDIVNKNKFNIIIIHNIIVVPCIYSNNYETNFKILVIQPYVLL